MNIKKERKKERYNMNQLKISESELFTKYKSTYISAFIDFSTFIFVLSCSLNLLWTFRCSWLSIFTIPLMSFLTNRAFIMFHDCCHDSYTPNKVVNYILSHITGMLVITSPNWILDHHTHHLTNGNIENKQNYFFNETILLTKGHFLSKPKKVQNMHRFYKSPFVFFTVIPLLYFGIAQHFIYSIKKYRHPNAFSQSLFMITINHIINNVLSGMYIYTLYKYELFWHYISWLCISSSIKFIVFHNQHSYNPPYIVGNKEWTQRDSGLKGSAFTQIPYYLKYFYMGIEYHHIHHMNAKIPGYNLQAYHEEVVSKSDIFDNVVKISMSDFIKNLWLTLYDEEQHKYVTFAEVDADVEVKHKKI